MSKALIRTLLEIIVRKSPCPISHSKALIRTLLEIIVRKSPYQYY